LRHLDHLRVQLAHKGQEPGVLLAQHILVLRGAGGGDFHAEAQFRVLKGGLQLLDREGTGP
jgi:hypothetical protein